MTREISLITPLSEPSRFFWRNTVRSVLQQADPNWRWIIVNLDTSSSVISKLQRLARADRRVTVMSSWQVSAQTVLTGEILGSLSTEFFVILPQHASLDRSAIEAVLRAVVEHPEADVLYGDEICLGRFGRLISRTRRPVWSPERLNGQMYFGDFVAYRTELVHQISRKSEFSSEALSYDLALRITEQAREILRIGLPLVHVKKRFLMRSTHHSKLEHDETAEESALRNHLARIGINAAVQPTGFRGTFLVTRDVTRAKPVSVIIPTRGSTGLVFGQHRVFVTTLIKSLIENSGRLNVEYVVVYDSNTPAEVVADLRTLAGNNLKLVSFDGPFNFSSKCNLGAVHASYEYLVFLNDDMQCLSENILAQLTVVLDEPGVGMTGAKLFFEDGSIQHGGHLHDLGDNRINYYGARADYPGREGALLFNREVSGVTGACIAMTRRLFTQVGGFSEQFPNSYNDVDLCNKVRGAGHRILWLAAVKMFHFESKSRVPIVASEDYKRIRARWGSSPDFYYA